MGRHSFHHRIQFLDGVIRLSETSSNDVTRVIAEKSILDADLLAVLERASIPDEQRMLLWALVQNPDALLRYGCDVTVSGWANFPDPPDEAVEPLDPDPAGGIALERPKTPSGVVV
jgi:hypothetical protein